MFENYDEDESATWIDTAQICLNGHEINASFTKNPIYNKNYCPDCGEKTIFECPDCHEKIPGEIHYNNVIGGSDFKLPTFCTHCGKSYPWTNKRLKAAQDLAAELDELNEDERKMLDKSIDEIIKNDPQAAVGATRFKKLMLKVGNSAGSILKDVITEVASETAKKVLLGN